MDAAPHRFAESARQVPSEAAAPARRPEGRSPSVLLVGSASTGALRSLEQAAEQAKLRVAVEVSVREADAWLEEHRPAAIAVDASAGSVERVLLHLRYNPMLANVPILGVAEDAGSALSDLAFEEIFGLGGDDLVPGDGPLPLARRLRRLALIDRAESAPASRARGLALVADADRRYRVLSARVLRNAGYDVVFAVDETEVLREAAQLGVSLVVSRLDLAEAEGPAGRGSAEPLAQRARRAGMAAPWIVAATPKEWARARRTLADVPELALYDAFGPPENMLFVANELSRRSGPDGRASPRLLFGSSVRFRLAGADEDEIGYSYNLSAGGLYVRTLAPLDRGSEVWLELLPPRSDRRVRLEGEVVWARGFGSNDATVPPGFGVRITGGSASDLDRFTRSYRAFADEMLNPRVE